MGNVIIPFDFRKGYAALEARAGIPASEISDRIRSTGLVPLFESGQLEPRDFVAQLTAALRADIDYDEFCGIWSSIFMPETLIPLDLVRALKQRYRVMVLSNTNAIHFNMVRQAYPILDHMDHFVLSHEVKALKPDPAIYEAAIAGALAQPAECFFTDDIPAYVEGARRAGIQAEQFLGYDKLLIDLRSRGVEI